jgi:iron complex transport system substrate-binding protein
MRICSLLPGATEVVAALGLADDLVAISHECDYPPAIRSKPVIIHSAINSDRTNSPDIDRQVRDTLKTGTSLYRIDEGLLRETDPDLIITQDLCEVCAVTPREIQRAIAGMARPPRILSLNPTRLDDVFHDIIEIGTATGRAPQALHWVAQLKDRVMAVRAALGNQAPRRVACLEWLDPIYSAGHWVPEIVSLARGFDLLAPVGSRSAMVSWEHVCGQAPDVLLLMPCGFSIARTLSELHRLTSRPGWGELPAVRSGEVFAVDGPAYFNRPGPRLVDGLELLAALFHPHRFNHRVPAGACRI